MAAELNAETIRPTSTGAVTPDLSPVVQGIVADNSSTDTVHPEESITISNPAADTSSTGAVRAPDAETFVNSGFAQPQPAPLIINQPIPAAFQTPADEAPQTKVITPKAKPAPKTSKTAETK